MGIHGIYVNCLRVFLDPPLAPFEFLLRDCFLIFPFPLPFFSLLWSTSSTFFFLLLRSSFFIVLPSVESLPLSFKAKFTYGRSLCFDHFFFLHFWGLWVWGAKPLGCGTGVFVEDSDLNATRVFFPVSTFFCGENSTWLFQHFYLPQKINFFSKSLMEISDINWKIISNCGLTFINLKLFFEIFFSWSKA
jgi:hypothetical protein